jgi:hypothetical protein
MKPVFLAMIGLFLVGCASTDIGTIIAQQPIDSSFEKITLRWKGTFGGANSVYYLKTFEQDGKVAVCGARVNEDTAVFDDLSDTWFDKAYVTIGSAQNKVASARFITGIDAPTVGRGAMARCVRTEAPANYSNLNGRARVRGGAITVTY